jgi:protein gp37
MAKRLKGMGQAKYQNDGDARTSGPGFGLTVHPDVLTDPLRWKKPRRIFVNSMSDLFHARVPDEFIARVWQVMGVTPQHTFQILTKRAKRMESWTNRWYSGEIPEPYDVRSIPGYEGYSVTTHGEVLGKRSDTRGGLKLDAGEQGHLRAPLYRAAGHSPKRELVHRLVLTAFVRPPRLGEQACHRNGDPSDNRLSNLYWGTQGDNWRDRLTHGNGRSYQKLSEQQVSQIRERHAAGQSAYSMAKDYGVSDTQIRNIVMNRQWATAHLVKVPTPAPARVVLDNCWLGTSVESQKYADIRIPALLGAPAAVRFLSCEPLLGPVRLTHQDHTDHERDWDGDWICLGCSTDEEHVPWRTVDRPSLDIDWVIIGGESGPGARPFDPEWAADLISDARRVGAAPFVKQLGSAWARDYTVAGKSVAAHGDTKGGKPEHWPADLRVREYPVTAGTGLRGEAA